MVSEKPIIGNLAICIFKFLDLLFITLLHYVSMMNTLTVYCYSQRYFHVIVSCYAMKMLSSNKIGIKHFYLSLDMTWNVFHLTSMPNIFFWTLRKKISRTIFYFYQSRISMIKNGLILAMMEICVFILTN